MVFVRVRFIGGTPEVYVPALRACVRQGEVIDVPEPLAAGLLAQTRRWARADDSDDE